MNFGKRHALLHASLKETKRANLASCVGLLASCLGLLCPTSGLNLTPALNRTRCRKRVDSLATQTHVAIGVS